MTSPFIGMPSSSTTLTLLLPALSPLAIKVLTGSLIKTGSLSILLDRYIYEENETLNIRLKIPNHYFTKKLFIYLSM